MNPININGDYYLIREIPDNIARDIHTNYKEMYQSYKNEVNDAQSQVNKLINSLNLAKKNMDDILFIKDMKTLNDVKRFIRTDKNLTLSSIQDLLQGDSEIYKLSKENTNNIFVAGDNEYTKLSKLSSIMRDGINYLANEAKDPDYSDLKYREKHNPSALTQADTIILSSPEYKVKHNPSALTYYDEEYIKKNKDRIELYKMIEKLQPKKQVQSLNILKGGSRRRKVVTRRKKGKKNKSKKMKR